MITLLADRLGYDAYGIEIEPELYETSRALSDEVGGSATFALGSFVPEDFRDEVSLLDADFHTPTEGADGYEELGMGLSDFDLVYAYPGERPLRVHHGRRGGLVQAQERSLHQ